MTQTYQLAAMAKMSRKPMRRKDSKLFAETHSVENVIVRTRCVCKEWRGGNGSIATLYERSFRYRITPANVNV